MLAPAATATGTRNASLRITRRRRLVCVELVELVAVMAAPSVRSRPAAEPSPWRPLALRPRLATGLPLHSQMFGYWADRQEHTRFRPHLDECATRPLRARGARRPRES